MIINAYYKYAPFKICNHKIWILVIRYNIEIYVRQNWLELLWLYKATFDTYYSLIHMQKNQVKPIRDKKKNIETTGILMGQNTNIFSQLSATFLQTKGSTTQQEQQFLKNTQIIQYHDQNINRLISLLRKKAEVTKVKAALQLREQISKMQADQVEQFIPTFAQLFLQIILNEPSRQIVDEFVTIVSDLIVRHKKIVVKEINTLYGPLLLSIKFSKLAGLLFTGSQAQLQLKSLVLLLKKQTSKKFLIMARIILECESKQKVGLAHYQRNCHSLMRTFKEFFRIFDKNEKAKDLQQIFVAFLNEVQQILQHQSIEHYLKLGGKPKAGILQLQTFLVSLAASHPECKIQWDYYAKAVANSFLEKDPLVQQTLWRGCNRQLLQSLILFDRVNNEQKGQQGQSNIHIYYAKLEQKVLNALKVGGLYLYKQLHHFCQILPSTSFTHHQNHKSLINKITFIRKLLSAILQEEDQNQARIQCYYNLVSLLLPRVKSLQLSKLDEKKAKEVKSLCNKLQKQTVQNLQDRFYSEPPVSKNSFTYYFPQYFGKLINELKPNFQIKFHPQLTFKLYEKVNFTHQNEPFLNEIFTKCQGSLSLLLKYMEIFPSRKIPIDMSDKNSQVQLASKLFILTNDSNQEWFKQSWDVRKSIIVYDPRITLRDLQVQEEHEEDVLTFKPTARAFSSKLYDDAKLDPIRYDYFIRTLTDPESIYNLKYLISLLNDVIIPRNPKLINSLLSLYKERVDKLHQGKWAIGKHQIYLLRVLSAIVIDHINKERSTKHIEANLLNIFLQNYCQFARLISNYKMDAEVQDLLKRFNNLLLHEDLRPIIFKSCQKSVLSACQATLKGGDIQQQKIRKNRLLRCVELINKLLWYSLSRTNLEGHIALAKQLISHPKNWNAAMTRIQPWILLHTLIEKLDEQKLGKFANDLVDNLQQNQHFIVLILSADALLPLQAHLQARQLFVSLKHQIERVILNLTAEPQQKAFQNIIQQLFTQGSIQLAQGIKNLISFILVEKEDDTEIINHLGDVCVKYPFELFVKQQRSIFRSLIFIDLITVIPLRKLANIEPIYTILLEKLSKAEGLKYMELLSIICVFWNKNVQIEDALPTFPNVLTKTVQSLSHHSINASPLTRNFATYTLFTLINTIVSQSYTGREILQSNEALINKQFWRVIEQGSQLHGLTQSVRMRYATRSILSAKQNTIQEMIQKLPKVGLQEFLFYKDLLAQIQDDSQQQLPHHQHIITLFEQFAQFLLRLISHLNISSQKPNEEVILELIQCPFPPLKKASFLLLKAMYELKIVSRYPPKIYAHLLKFSLKPEEQLNTGLCSQISTYLYTWQALLLRREATERIQNEQQILSLEDYIQAQGFSDLLIKNCFVVLEDKLDYLRNEAELLMTSEQLLQANVEMDLYEESGLQQKLFKMTLQTLFSYIINFPIFLRTFMDFNKKYKNICDRLLRSIISDAIFKEEVKKIELLESRWKADGNFQIYVTPKNKQIYAQYTHDVIRIGLRLVMRGNYPLSPIDIQFGQGLKIEEGGRWSLMLQSQLHNRNNTIINGILLWKENIDKKLSGVQECAICFDIVNSSGQLPKKGCKTCKKRFHGNCIMKWFAKSNKSECPLCKSQFL